MANNKKNTARDRIRAEFLAWRKSKGREVNAKTGDPFSYQQIVDSVNYHFGDSRLRYPTVASWGTRGTVPKGQNADALRAVHPDCAILRYARS